MIRYELIIDAITRLARIHGLSGVSRLMLSEELGIPDGSFNKRTGRSFTKLIIFVRERYNIQETMGNHARLNASIRKESIIQTGLELSLETNFNEVTREDIAKKMQLSGSLVRGYFSAKSLQKEILNAAIVCEALPIIAQAMVCNFEPLPNISVTLKRKVVKWLANK